MAIIRVGELISGRLIYIDSEDNVIKAAILRGKIIYPLFW